MSSPDVPQAARREALLQAVMQAGRENSTASVLLHSAISEKMGLGVTDEKTLDILFRRGPLTAGDLAAHTGLAPASVTGLIDRLERKGFVQRVRDPKDRRRVIVELNAERAAEVMPLFDSFAQAMTELFSHYTNEQLAVILDFLVRSTNVMQAEIGTVGRGAAPHAPEDTRTP